MSNLSAHRHSLVNSIPQTQQNSHQSNLTAPIHPENDSVDDVVFLCTVPKVPHSPEDYDPECQCSTCKLATKLLEECTCEECKGTGQEGRPSENLPIANAVSPTNDQPSSSSIQNNDASTSEHTNANDQNDDHSRSSTPDYLPRFFDDESGDSSSDDSENDDDEENNKEFDQESESEENNDNSDPDYALSDSSLNDSEDDDENDSIDNMEVDKESESLNSIVNSQPSTSYQNASVTNLDISNSSDNGSTNSKVEGTEQASVKCPKCTKTFTEKHKILRHYRAVHQEWKPYYCRWPKCNFASPLHDLVVHHANRTHFKSQNRHKARKYVGKRDETPPKDTIFEKISEIKFQHEEIMNCPQCGRKLQKEHIKRHIRTHASPGIQCTWPNCRFFYSQLPDAKKHLSVDHLQVEQANSPQIIQHLVKVNPKPGKTTKIKVNKKQKTGSNIGPIPVKCPKCTKTFTQSCILLRHYRAVHQEWKPYYCLWPKCNFKSAVDNIVVTHADKVHFKFQNRQKAKTFVGKREEVPSKGPVFEQIVAIKFVRKNKSNCSRCGRKLSSENLKLHILSHSNPGFRCLWPNCGFFYSNYEYAKKHLLREHLKGKLVNATQLNQHLINVNPNSPNSNGSQNNDASTSERFNASDQNDDSERSSTQNYMSRKFDDDGDYKDHDYESECESDSDDDGRDGFSKRSKSKRPIESFAKGKSNMGQAPIKCPKCEQTFTQKSKLLFHYGRVHQEWKPFYCQWPKCNFTSAIDHLVITHADQVHFKLKNRQKAKAYVGKREEAPPKDPELEQIEAFKFDNGKKGFGLTRSSCPQCGRNLYAENIKNHIRTHEKPGYSCAWSNCGFFFSQRTEAKKHLYSDHLRVEKANSQQTKRYLVKVNPKTGKTSKVIIRQIKEENNHDNSEDEEDSDSDDEDENSEI